MMVTALDNFQGCLTKDKEYPVFSRDGFYILIVEDSGRLVWNWIGIFKEISKGKSPNLKMETNWNFI